MGKFFQKIFDRSRILKTLFLGLLSPPLVSQVGLHVLFDPCKVISKINWKVDAGRGHTQLDSFMQNIQWMLGGGGKRITHFQNFCIKISSKEVSVYSFHLLYILLVQKLLPVKKESCQFLLYLIMENIANTLFSHTAHLLGTQTSHVDFKKKREIVRVTKVIINPLLSHVWTPNVD